MPERVQAGCGDGPCQQPDVPVDAVQVDEPDEVGMRVESEQVEHAGDDVHLGGAFQAESSSDRAS